MFSYRDKATLNILIAKQKFIAKSDEINAIYHTNGSYLLKTHIINKTAHIILALEVKSCVLFWYKWFLFS